MAKGELRYEFGRNWLEFVDSGVDSRSVRLAIRSLGRMLETDSLAELGFLDIGCGSGLSSLAAIALGAKEVHAFDVDRQSIEAARSLRRRFQIPEGQWKIEEGSVLDRTFLESLPASEVVYSWGVLHHTGQMWKAVDNAASLVVPGGRLAIAIYNRVDRLGDSSSMWWKIKRRYNRSPEGGRRLMELTLLARVAGATLAKGRNPMVHLRQRDRRGMRLWTDVRDWLGGFPYEYASVDEVFNHLHGGIGFDLVGLRSVEGNGCNEFVFRRPNATRAD